VDRTRLRLGFLSGIEDKQSLCRYFTAAVELTLVDELSEALWGMIQ
jgi:hypothetical protein